MICLWLADAGAATLRLPLVMRVEGRMVPTNAFLIINANVVDAPLETWVPKAPQEKTFSNFLRTVAGPASEKAAAAIAEPMPGGDSLSPATLIQLYQGLLKMPDRRVLFSIDFRDRTLFLWKTAQANGRGARVAATVVRNEAGQFKISAPAGDDNLGYLFIRSLQSVAESGQIDKIMRPAAAATDPGYRVFQIVPGVQLAARVSVSETSTPLSCADGRNSTPALLVGCWMTGGAFEPQGMSSLSAESQPKFKQWLSTLPPGGIAQLKALPAGPIFHTVTFDLGAVAVVYPSLLSPLLGNKRGVHVNNSAPRTIVNFFSADFADEILSSAHQQIIQSEQK
jgi:hypothetical protein